MSDTPRTDAILLPLLLMLQAATSNDDCKTATIHVVRHAITHAKAMERELAEARASLAPVISRLEAVESRLRHGAYMGLPSRSAKRVHDADIINEVLPALRRAAREGER